MSYLVSKNGQQQGPYTVEQINDLIQQGQLSPDDYVFTQGWEDWRPISTILGLQAPPTPSVATPKKPMGGVAKGCLIVSIVVVVLGLIGLVGCFACAGGLASTVDSINESAKEGVNPPAPISNLSWTEIDEIYDVKSKYTELQKKELWKNYEGKRVEWSGKVTHVDDVFGTLSLQIKIDPDTFTSDLLIRLRKSERDKALKLSEDDRVTFRGTLDDWGTLMPVTLTDGEIVE
jgi:hypothetical protein